MKEGSDQLNGLIKWIGLLSSKVDQEDHCFNCLSKIILEKKNLFKKADKEVI